MIWSKDKRGAACKWRRKYIIEEKERRRKESGHKCLVVFSAGLIFFIMMLTIVLNGIRSRLGSDVEQAVIYSGCNSFNDDEAVGNARTEEMEPYGGQMGNLETALYKLIENDTGTWCIYVKNLSSGQSLSINNQSMYAASLIKLFVMEETFANIDTVIKNADVYGDSLSGYDTLSGLMELMIEQSDNEAYNEIVRLHSASYSFTEGCLAINKYLQSDVYSDTGIYHTLSPSNTVSESTSSTEKNHTSVEDVGLLLEAIYNGICVSQTASEEMLDLLLNQEKTYKIAAGVPNGVIVANKTGETEDYEHDAAIVYGRENDYILCVMSEYSEASAITMIKKISETVYGYLNGTADTVVVDGNEKTGSILEKSDSEIPYSMEEEFVEETNAREKNKSSMETELVGGSSETCSSMEETASAEPPEGWNRE